MTNAAIAISDSPPPPPPSVSVVIITRNQRHFLARSLPALAGQTGLNGPVQVIVVDSGSTDGARELVRESGATLVDIEPKLFNYARAYNYGAEKAIAPFIVRLSGDAVPGNDRFLSSLITPLLDDTSVAATWGRQRIPLHVRNPLERWFERKLRPASASRPRRYRRNVSVLGSGMALRRDLWSAHPFEERLPQAEDYEWMHHHLKRWWEGVWVPEATILHGHDESLPRALRRSLSQSAVQGLILAGVWNAVLPQRPLRVDTV